MANAKITDLTELTAVQGSDVLPIVDTLNDQTKKVTVTNLVATGLGTGVITTDKIADDAVTAAKLEDTTVTAGSYTLTSLTVDQQGRSGTAADTDKIVEGNSEAEVVDTGSDGHFKVTTEGSERIRVGPAGQVGIAGANYGTSGQVLTSGGSSGAVSWQDAAAGATGVILENQQAISSNDTLTTNYNGLSVGPVTIQNSLAVTVPNGAVWMIL